MIEVVMHAPDCTDLLDTAPTLEAAIPRLAELAWEDDDATLLRTSYTLRAAEGGTVVGTGQYVVLADFDRPILVITAGGNMTAFCCVPTGDTYRAVMLP
jgi:hypothetical protein